MLKKLITEKNQFVGNLHCHTTLSDGTLAPEAVCRAYKERGYSFIALTDHDTFFEHPEIKIDDFVVLNAYEHSIDETGCERRPFKHNRCYHLNFYADSPAHHPYLCPPQPAYEDKEGINAFIAAVKKQGFLCSYNHPYWSLQNFSDYQPLRGVDFVEIYNHGCYVSDGLHENQVCVYDEMLRWGEHESLYCVMTDDNHNRDPLNSPRSDSFGGKTIVNAQELSYAALIDALRQGHFYCTNGPRIHEMTFDTQTRELYVRCSAAQSVSLSTEGRQANRVTTDPNKQENELVFPVKGAFVRLEVLAPDGRHANTNAYYPDRLSDTESD